MRKQIHAISLILALLLFLCIAAAGIHRKAQATVAPPIYDPLSYYSKAESVSTAIGHGEFNLLNVGNPGRPFGSTLLLYPFGFKPSIKGYIFRSTFVPIILWGLALGACFWPLVKSKTGLLVALSICTGMLTLPLFYQFEINDEFIQAYGTNLGGWGLVDALLGSVAGLAVALLLNGMRTRNFLVVTASWIVSGFTLFIKPSGMLVMAITIGIALIELIGQIMMRPSDWRNSLKFSGKSLGVAVALFALVVTSSIKSNYLASETIAYFKNATSIIVNMFRDIPKFSFFRAFIPCVIGWWWFFPMIIFAFYCAARIVFSGLRREVLPLALRVFGLLVFVTSGVWWLIYLAGPQHRYLYFLIQMMIVWFIPDLFECLRRAKIRFNVAVFSYCLIPAVLLLTALCSRHPSTGLQKLLGVNLSVGQYAQESTIGRSLLDESSKLGRVLEIYSIGGSRVGVIEMIDWVQSVDHGNAAHQFHVMRPLDWVSNPGIKVHEVLQSDFMLLEDVAAVAPKLNPITVENWPVEVQEFKQFAYAACKDNANGVVLVSDGSVKLLRILEKQKFADAVSAWAKSIQWRNDFPERNKSFLEGAK